MRPVIYLPAIHYSSNLIKDMRQSLWNVNHYGPHSYGLYTCSLVVPIIYHENRNFLEFLSESHGVDVLLGTIEKTISLALTSQGEASVEIPQAYPFKIEQSDGKAFSTKVRIR